MGVEWAEVVSEAVVREVEEQEEGEMAQAWTVMEGLGRVAMVEEGSVVVAEASVAGQRVSRAA